VTHQAKRNTRMLLVTCEQKNSLRWSGRQRTAFMYPSRGILTLSLRHWKIFSVEKFSCV